MATSENKPLDKNQPYGTVRGRLESYPSARYVQEGRFYNEKGVLLNPVVEEVKEELPPPAPPAPEPDPEPAPAPEPETAPLPEPEPAPQPEKKAKKLNLPGLPTKD